MQLVRNRVWVLGCCLLGCTGLVGQPPLADAGTEVVDGGSGDAGSVDAGPVDAGRTGLPVWLRDAGLNRWIEIPNTVLAGSPGAPGEDPLDPYAQSNRAVGAYSGMAFRDDTSEIYVAAAGGHGDSSDNAVRSIALAEDAPVWRLRCPATPVAQRAPDVAYYADGKPTSRHTYWSSHWSSTRGRVMLHRTRFSYGSAVSFDDSNGFDPVTGQWDPDNTWHDGVTAQARDHLDRVWAMARTKIYQWDPATDVWTMLRDFGGDELPQGPLAEDTSRGSLFAFAWGDGQGYGLDSLSAWRFSADGQTRDRITFTPSAALTRFSTQKPAYAALEYDPAHDRFLFYASQVGALNDVYVITPNASTTWDLSLLPLDSAGVTPMTAGGGGLMSKFRYVPALGGFVLFPSTVHNLYFLKTE